MTGPRSAIILSLVLHRFYKAYPTALLQITVAAFGRQLKQEQGKATNNSSGGLLVLNQKPHLFSFTQDLRQTITTES